MDIKKLKTNLFIVNDFCSQVGLLSKATSFYSGMLYYRIDWLEEDIETAVNKPIQQKLLKDITLMVVSMGEDKAPDVVWTYIKLPLIELFAPAHLNLIEKRVKDMVKYYMQNITSDDLFRYQATSPTDEEEEVLDKIRKELNELDKEFATTYS